MSDPTYVEYHWKKGTRYKVDVNRVVEERKELERVHGEGVPKGALLERAKEEDHFMHHVFEWDDSGAGHKYRMDQEDSVWRAVVVVEKTAPDMSATEYRAYTPMQPKIVEANSSDKISRWYETRVRLQTSEGREIILERARKELEAFKNKYAHLTEFAELILVLDSILEEDK